MTIEDGGDEEFTETESSAIFLTGTREPGTTVTITISDLSAVTPDVVTVVPPGGASYVSGATDLSGLAFGRVTATAVAAYPGGGSSAPGTDTSRKVPLPGRYARPIVEIRDGVDGYVSPREEDDTAVEVVVTNVDASLSGFDLLVRDGIAAHEILVGPQALAVDVPFTFVVDMSGLNDGPVSATARAIAASVEGRDDTILDREGPVSTIRAPLWPTDLELPQPLCVVVVVVNLSTCALDGTSADSASPVEYIYVTGVNTGTGQAVGRTALIETGGLGATWSLAPGPLGPLDPGMWRFEARGTDAAGNTEIAATDFVEVLVL